MPEPLIPEIRAILHGHLLLEALDEIHEPQRRLKYTVRKATAELEKYVDTKYRLAGKENEGTIRDLLKRYESALSECVLIDDTTEKKLGPQDHKQPLPPPESD